MNKDTLEDSAREVKLIGVQEIADRAGLDVKVVRRFTSSPLKANINVITKIDRAVDAFNNDQEATA
jgi:inorganic pyrophosphatase